MFRQIYYFILALRPKQQENYGAEKPPHSSQQKMTSSRVFEKTKT